ncbi:conjugal transfer pilus assembly protein TraB [Hephaestia caeni]|uniref:Conjugal transfer pilus assembly protein TraB n=1 Tax=Hephaestia caeni TaxID=645617 RepID=A0A397PEC9_9SPHN|nr:TraB/VirB10 family protein [Hephaestia caeni]RIA46279.1 conjugal transfer pilus assembly protein TraB [Hephaestia caeni]
MNLRNLFSRERRPLDAQDVSPVGDDLVGNEAVRRKQRLLLGGASGLLLIASAFWIFDDSEAPKAGASGAQDVKIATDDMVNRNMSEREWMAASENRFQSTENQLRSMGTQQQRIDQLAQQVATLQTQNQSMAADGQRVLSAYQQENEQLRAQVNGQRAAPVPAPSPGPAAMYGSGSPGTYQQPQAAVATAPAPVSQVKVVAFETGGAVRAERGNTVYSDSPEYLPPNSFASARVIVGVDAGAGVSSQTDPLPVVLRITGPARSVVQNGRVLTTRIEGCLVNGAARGDLSSEKVYVKLQKMTCEQPGGRVAVSEVKGFIAFAGKTGVRGRVVSREGSLVTQAFLAGLVGGFGRGFSANTSTILSGTNITTDGKRQRLSTGEILEGGFGEGVAQTGDMVSQYLIERAEQYQPVIEMPTGIDVEIVFLEGAYVRN